MFKKQAGMAWFSWALARLRRNNSGSGFLKLENFYYITWV
jgi:hypothetical protein